MAVGRTVGLGDCAQELGSELVAVVGAVERDELCEPCEGFLRDAILLVCELPADVVHADLLGVAQYCRTVAAEGASKGALPRERVVLGLDEDKIAVEAT